MPDIFEEGEIGNSADFDKYKRENYLESSNENDHVPCYLAADLSASAGSSKKVFFFQVWIMIIKEGNFYL